LLTLVITASLALPPVAIAQSDPHTLPVPDSARIARLAAQLSRQPSSRIPAFDDRSFWDRWGSTPGAAAIVANATRQLAGAMPELTPAAYDAFLKTGERKVFERPYGQRLEWLVSHVLAEGAEDKGKHLAAIETALASILAEPSWAMSAHAGKRVGWDRAYDNVDLGAAQRAWTLALCDWLLGNRLAAVTRTRLRTEASSRIFEPCLERIRSSWRYDFWWMNTTNNWNAVCHAGVLGAALLLVDDPATRAEFAAAFEALTPLYLSGFGDDGYCHESLGYWNYGFGHYLVGAEALRHATGGQTDLLSLPKVRRIAEFGIRWEISGNVYPAFSDVSLTAGPAPWLLDFVARRFDIGAATDSPPAYTRQPLYQFLFALSDIPGTDVSAASGKPSSEATTLPLRDWFPDGGALIVRRSPDTVTRLAAAFKGGHNGQPHNHNDLGSFVLLCDGETVLTDLGSDTYVKDTFGPKRYTSGVMNSFGHPVPRVAGQLQRTGADARAVTLHTGFTDKADTWEIDLTSAYDVPALERLTRTFVFTRADGGRLEIVDRVRFKPGQPQTFGTALVLLPGRKKEKATASGFRVGPVEISWSADADTTAIILLSEDPVHGIVPGQAPRGTRLGLDFTAPVSEATLHLLVAPAR
jgi:hypothetical protein